ncbi:MAG: tripartite tricarboxylate transporter TctB family protein [Lautropia sp.]
MARRPWLDAVLWAAFGLVIVIASWRMDRLEHQGINPWSVPGLMPGVVGVMMILIAAALLWRGEPVPQQPASDRPAPDQPALDPGASGHPASLPPARPAPDGDRDTGPGEGVRTLIAAVLCIAFAGLTLGHGWSFFVEGAGFIFLFTTVFSWRDWREQRRIGRGLALTLAIAIAASALISWLFESVFLVRLP